VLVITTLYEDRIILVVSLPMPSTATFPKSRINAHKGGKAVVARYAAVERIHKAGKRTDNEFDKGRSSAEVDTQWLMCTTSNAGGALPMGLQATGIPGAIIKDIGWFLEWCDKKRGDGVNTPLA
jgi:Protein of unknown function (DUF3074)